MRLVAEWMGERLAESDGCFIVGGVYYFPPGDVDPQKLRYSSYTAECPWKGTANFFDIVVKGRVNENAAWYYPEPREGYEHVRGAVAFWNGIHVYRVDEDRGLHSSGAEATGGDGELDHDRLLDFLLGVPKTEIHLHLEATLSAQLLYEMIRHNGVAIPGIETPEDLVRRFQVRTLNEFISLFLEVIQPSIAREEDMRFLVKGARDYMMRNNIVYAELFFAPSNLLSRGLDYRNLVDVIQREADRYRDQDGVEMRFLVDVSRSFGPENAMKNLELVLEHPREAILGIGLGGAETKGPAEDYAEVFRKAREAGIHAVAHAGEAAGPESIWASCRTLGAERIGHALSAMHDDSLIDYLAETKTPVECCPTSNVFTKAYIDTIEEHPLSIFAQRGVPVTLNTDDPTIFGVELVDEYLNAYHYQGFDIAGLIGLMRQGLEATFLPESRKQALRARMEQAIEMWRPERPEGFATGPAIE